MGREPKSVANKSVFFFFNFAMQMHKKLHSWNLTERFFLPHPQKLPQK